MRVRVIRALLFLGLAVLPFAACSKGKFCDRCANINDCDEGAGLACQQFHDSSGAIENLCGHPSNPTESCSTQ